MWSFMTILLQALLRILRDLHTSNPSNFTCFLWQKSSLAQKVIILQILQNSVKIYLIMLKTVVDTSVRSYKNEDDFLKPFMDELLACYGKKQKQNKKLEKELKKRLENCILVEE